MHRTRWLAFACFVVVVLVAPALLFASQGDTSAPSTTMGLLVAAILVPIIPWVFGKAYDGLKTVFPFFDRLPPLVHQVLAPLFGVASGWLTASFGVAAFTDLHGITPGLIGGVFNALAMGGIKRWEKSQHPVDATVVVEASRESGVTSPVTNFGSKR